MPITLSFGHTMRGKRPKWLSFTIFFISISFSLVIPYLVVVCIFFVSVFHLILRLLLLFISPECFLFSFIFVVWKPSTEIIIRRLIDKFYVRFYFCLFSSVCRLFSCFDASMPDLLPFGISNLYLYFANLNEIWCMWVLAVVAVAVVFFFLSLFTSIKTRIELKGFL